MILTLILASVIESMHQNSEVKARMLSLNQVVMRARHAPPRMSWGAGAREDVS